MKKFAMFILTAVLTAISTILALDAIGANAEAEAPVVNNMADSAVEIAVKQYVLVPERIGYIDRSKEVIYEALNAAGISIPFPQCDVHLVKEDK